MRTRITYSALVNWLVSLLAPELYKLIQALQPRLETPDGDTFTSLTREEGLRPEWSSPVIEEKKVIINKKQVFANLENNSLHTLLLKKKSLENHFISLFEKNYQYRLFTDPETTSNNEDEKISTQAILAKIKKNIRTRT